jgi:hypothetical protein
VGILKFQIPDFTFQISNSKIQRFKEGGNVGAGRGFNLEFGI